MNCALCVDVVHLRRRRMPGVIGSGSAGEARRVMASQQQRGGAGAMKCNIDRATDVRPQSKVVMRRRDATSLSTFAFPPVPPCNDKKQQPSLPSPPSLLRRYCCRRRHALRSRGQSLPSQPCNFRGPPTGAAYSTAGAAAQARQQRPGQRSRHGYYTRRRAALAAAARAAAA